MGNSKGVMVLILFVLLFILSLSALKLATSPVKSEKIRKIVMIILMVGMFVTLTFSVVLIGEVMSVPIENNLP